jgi:hypothetical protein
MKTEKEIIVMIDKAEKKLEDFVSNANQSIAFQRGQIEALKSLLEPAETPKEIVTDIVKAE